MDTISSPSSFVQIQGKPCWNLKKYMLVSIWLANFLMSHELLINEFETTKYAPAKKTPCGPCRAFHTPLNRLFEIFVLIHFRPFLYYLREIFR
jgi:hypothetical protein